MKKPPVSRSTQSICVGTVEADTIARAAGEASLSVSSWGYSRLMAALATKATRAACFADLSGLAARPGPAVERTRRVSVIMTSADYAVLKATAGAGGVSAHALAQAVLIADAERIVAARPAQGRAARSRDTLGPADDCHDADPEVAAVRQLVKRMAEGMGLALWPDRRGVEPGSAASYEATLANRRHVRAGMVRVSAKADPGYPDGTQRAIEARLDPHEVAWMAAAMALPETYVARAIVLRCQADHAKAMARAADVADVDALVADAMASGRD